MNLMYSLPAALMYLVLCVAVLQVFTCHASTGFSETLREAASRHSLYMGSEFDGALVGAKGTSHIDVQYRNMHAHEYSLSTVGNMCKWAATHPEQHLFTLQDCNSAYAYARQSGQQFRGHNLCWGSDNPTWLTSKQNKWTQQELLSLLAEHVTRVMQGVKKAAGGVSPLAWDVVNEAVNGTAWYKPNFWYPALPDYVDVAFKAARAADNSTLLFYNDFGVEFAGYQRAEQMHKMVKSMATRGIPIDGVGLQAHLLLNIRGACDSAQHDDSDIERHHYTCIDAYDSSILSSMEEAVSANIARYGNLGLQVHITEMDVKCPDPCNSNMRQRQADVYTMMLRACLQNKGVCTSFETWGFTDRYTWLSGPRCEHARCHPLPFDEEYTPKMAAKQMLALLQQWPTTSFAKQPARMPKGLVYV